MKGTTIRLLLIGLFMAGSVASCYRHVRHDEKSTVERRIIVTEVEPPAPRVEVQTDTPTPGYVWTGGYWNWENDAYTWSPGRWQAPRDGYHWVSPTWEKYDGKWHLQGGYWEAN